MINRIPERIIQNYPAVLNFALQTVDYTRYIKTPTLIFKDIAKAKVGTYSSAHNRITLNSSYLEIPNWGSFVYLEKAGKLVSTKSVLNFGDKNISVPSFILERQVLPTLKSDITVNPITIEQMSAMYYTALLHEIRHFFNAFLPQEFYPLPKKLKTGCAYVGVKNLSLGEISGTLAPLSYFADPREISAYSYAAKHTPDLLSWLMPNLDKNLTLALAKSQHYKAIAGLRIQHISHNLYKQQKHTK